MKQITWIALAFFTIASATTFADERTAVWERIYRNSVNDEMRYSVLLNVKELSDRGFSPLLMEALADVLARQIELGDNNAVEAKVKLATTLVQQLGDLKENAAADLVFQVYKDVKKYPFLKAEAIVCLGKMRATEYAPELTLALSSITNKPDRDATASQEILAFAFVQALGLMKELKSYESVFLASIGWYSPVRKVKETAKTVLKTMVEDPTEPLIALMKRQSSFVDKLRALEASDESSAPAARKVLVVQAALDDGTRLIAQNVLETTQLSDLRKKAYAMVAKYQDRSNETATLLKSAYKTATLTKDTTEILTILQTLGANASNEAAAFLNELMVKFNEREKSKLTTDFDVQQIRTILQSMKTIGNPVVKPALMEAQFLYTPALQRNVKEVLAAFGNK